MAERFDEFMGAADALMWNIEKDPILRSTIVTVVRLDRSPDWDRLVDKVERGAALIPRLRQRVVTPFLRVGPPHWSADPNFDLSYHLRRVRAPEPATFESVLDFARTVAMGSFDRARPLWEFTLVEGLRDGGAALVMKVHHSMTDGVGGMRLAMMLFDMERDPGDPGPCETPTLEVLTPFGLVGRSLEYGRRQALALVRRGIISALEAPRRTLLDPGGAVRRAATTVGSVAHMLRPAMLPESSLMRQRSLARRLATLEVPLDDLKRSAKAVGGTVNDAFVAAVAGGLRRYHERRGGSITDLRMTMPINVRTEGAALGGNQFTPARFLVPMTIDDPGERIQMVGRIAREAREEPAVRMTDALAGVLNQLPTAITTQLFGAMLKGVDFVTSNVPGAPFPVYLAGAELERNFAFGPLTGAAVNVVLVSHNGICCIGVNADVAAIDDLDGFMDALDGGFAEIVALGATGPEPEPHEHDLLAPAGSGFTLA